MRDAHAGWARHLKLIESCINESYHDTIGMTPFQAQYGEMPPRSWTRYLDKDIITDKQKVSTPDIYLRIKEKRQKRADRINEKNKLTTFELGDKVLLRANPMSDAINKIVAKFCDLYEGPYIVKKKIGKATYTLSYVEDQEKERGNFNIRQLKAYYE